MARPRSPFRRVDDDGWRLPNARGKNQTPASLKIDLHYAHLRIYERWNWDRFVRLANFLGVTPYELGSIVCIQHRSIDAFKSENRLKVGRRADRAAALVLTLLEAHCQKLYSDDIIENPFPTLESVPTDALPIGPKETRLRS